MIITFDFDSTLTKEQFDEDYGVRYIGPNETMVEKLKSYFKDGNQIQVVTSRHEAFEKQYPEYTKAFMEYIIKFIVSTNWYY